MLDIIETTIPELTGDEERRVYIYEPDFSGRFPVLYMYDGQNVFLDEDATYGKSWGMLKYLDDNEIPLIVVGVECNHHDEKDKCGGRLSEYTPFDFSDPYWGNIKARGKKTMDWFTKALKPYIDDNYRTLKDREHTYIAGSSMGGLMSLYSICRYNKIFSKACCLSPSLIFAPDEVMAMIEKSRLRKKSHVYLDYGENEIRYRNAREVFAKATEALMRKNILVTSRIIEDGNHNEESWEKQIPHFMAVLLNGR